MSKSIIGTQTEKNLLKAFAGEAQARNRYTYFSSAAKKEGLMQKKPPKPILNCWVKTGNTCLP